MEQNDQVDKVPINRPKGLFVHPAVHRRMKLYVAQHGGSMQETAEKAVTEWLDRQEQEAAR